MCLIVKQTNRRPLTDDEVRQIYQRNRDGFGVAWHDDAGRANFWRRVPVDAADAVHLYQHAIRLATEDRPIVCHWRMATSGHVVDDLAHPFPVPGGVLIHNGVLPTWAAAAAPGQSDTAALAAHITRAATPDMYDRPAFRAWLARESTGSAIVLVRDGHVVDHYGNAGLEHNDRWLSNTYAGPASLYPPRPVVTYGAGWRGGWRWGGDDDDTDPRWTRTRSGWALAVPPTTAPTSDKPPADRPLQSVTTTTTTTARRKRAKLRRVRADGPDGVDVDALARGGCYLQPMTIRAAGEALAAVAPAGAGWFLLDDDPDVVRWGIEEFADTLRPGDGLAVRVVDLPRDRVVIRVVDADDKPRADRPAEDDPIGWYPVDMD